MMLLQGSVAAPRQCLGPRGRSTARAQAVSSLSARSISGVRLPVSSRKAPQSQRCLAARSNSVGVYAAGSELELLKEVKVRGATSEL